MKSSHIFSLILSFASIGLSLPAVADQAIVSEIVQSATVSGDNNSVTQRSTINTQGVSNAPENNGVVIRSRQVADVQGNNNTVNQSSEINVEDRHRYRQYRH